MTKMIKIINDDESNHEVVIQVFKETADGSPDILEQEVDFSIPGTEFTDTIYVGKYLVIREVDSPD